MQEQVTESVYDLLDVEVQEGDRVAVAFRAGNTAEMRVGTIESFSYGAPLSGYNGTSNGRDIKILITWDKTGYWDDKPSKIYARLKRFVKIG